MREITSTLSSFAVACFLCVVCASAQGGASAPCEELTFAPPAYFGSGLAPRALAAADLNGDGNTDLAAANESSNSVLIRFGDGHGNFPSSQLLTGSTPSDVVVTDLNHDGVPDVVFSQRSNSQLNVRLGLGGGVFSTPVLTPVGASPSGLIAADFNNDGHVDLAATSGGTSSVSILLGNGTGAYPVSTNVSIGSGSSAWALVASDLNGDGNLDIATANRGSNNISVLFGNGAGGFGAARVFTTGTAPVSIAAGDFNGDGRPDLATANEGSNTVTVRLNNGFGSFPTAATLSSGAQPFAVAAADLDNDSDSDLVVTNQGSNSLSVFRGDGHGVFAPRLNFAVKAAARSLIVEDLDHDGSVDLATGIGTSFIAVLLNGCAQNTAPTISSGVVTRQQDAGTTRSTIATVGDAEESPNELAVTINGGGSAFSNGVTVSNLGVDASGNVTADVSASCGSSDATFTLAVSDGEGLSATANLNVDVDFETTPPVINSGSPLPNVTVYLPAGTSDNSVPVTFNLPKAADNCTASPSVTSEPESGSVFNRGTTVVTVTSRDELGNEAAVTFNVTVLFNFGGFLQPINPLPALNNANAGGAVPIKFSLSGDRGMNILAAGYPASSAIPCEQNVPGPTMEPTASTGDGGLSYDPVSGEYKYVWKTSRDWRRSCRMLIVRLTDGSEYYAKFSFR